MKTITSRDIELLNNLAALQISCGRPQSSLPLLHLAFKLDERDPQTNYLLANAYLRLQEYENSAKYFDLFEKAKKQHTSMSELIMKSIVQLKNGEFSEAKNTFMSAVTGSYPT
ncbi:MAG: hypothetical protein AAF228_13035 [Pseudomonadota bacterium]